MSKRFLFNYQTLNSYTQLLIMIYRLSFDPFHLRLDLSQNSEQPTVLKLNHQNSDISHNYLSSQSMNQQPRTVSDLYFLIENHLRFNWHPPKLSPNKRNSLSTLMLSQDFRNCRILYLESMFGNEALDYFLTQRQQPLELLIDNQIEELELIVYFTTSKAQ